MLQFANANLTAAERVWSEPRKDTSEVLVGAKKEKRRTDGRADAASIQQHIEQSHSSERRPFLLIISLVRHVG